MDIRQADSAGNDGIGTLSSPPPEVAPNHVWAKIEAIESSNRARLRPPPSLHPGLLADGRLLSHSPNEVDDDNDIDEHEDSDVKSRFIPEMVEDLLEEADESTKSHEYEGGDSDPICIPASLEDDLQEAEEGAEAGEDTYFDE